MPSLSDVHNALANAFRLAVSNYREARPSRTIAVVGTVRSLASQKRAFSGGKSKLDGVARPSIHQYSPKTPAMDCWVYDVIDPDVVPDEGFFEGRPRELERAGKLKLILIPGKLTQKAITREYLSWGYIAQETPVCGFPWESKLVWGGTWSQPHDADRLRKARFFDGPHLELARRDLTYEVQRMLDLAGYPPGPLDGIVGRKTKRAFKAYAEGRGIEVAYVPRRRTFPFRTSAWEALCEDTEHLL